MIEQTANEQSNAVLDRARIGERSAGEARVLAVRHWNERLFSFKVERPDSLRFRSGEFVMLGLMADVQKNGKPRPLLRAYSIASPSWDEELEFYSIKVPDGPLTSRLQYLQPGDDIILRTRPVGTLVLDALLPGRNLWLLATGTGIAPFASIIRDPDTYEKYERIILMHTCRANDELDYGRSLISDIRSHEFLTEIVGEKLTYFPATTREKSDCMGRITVGLESGSALKALGVESLSVKEDRFMMCGSLAFNLEMQKLLKAQGFVEGSQSDPGSFVIEKAFVD
ncbi:MAG: ferredoxin--NADP reductase [Granulosicoccus sp.]